MLGCASSSQKILIHQKVFKASSKSRRNIISMSPAASTKGTKNDNEIVRLLDEDPRFSEITIHNGIVYLCGQVGAGDDIRAQTKETIDEIDRLLALAGTDKTRLLNCTIWVKDIKNDYAGMNEIYNEWIKDGKPTRACVEANMVYKKEGAQLLVEIQATAALP